MSSKIQNNIQKNRLLKINDPEINLYILLDQANGIMSNAIDLELRHLKTTQPQVRVLTMLSREDRPVTIEELANWCLKEFNSVSPQRTRMNQKG